VDIGIAYDLKEAVRGTAAAAEAAEDRLEEYDSEETIDAIAGAHEARGHQVR
jgi:hypothetical protein